MVEDSTIDRVTDYKEVGNTRMYLFGDTIMVHDAL